MFHFINDNKERVPDKERQMNRLFQQRAIDQSFTTAGHRGGLGELGPGTHSWCSPVAFQVVGA